MIVGQLAAWLRRLLSDSDYEKLRKIPPTEPHVCCQAFHNVSVTSRFFPLATIILLITTVLLTAVQLGQHTPQPQVGVRLTCGTSVAEARTRNCHFDLLAKAWLPEPCSKHGLDEFIIAGAQLDGHAGNKTWQYWESSDGGRGLDLEEVAAMGDGNKHGVMWWTTRREHSVHCAWMLLRMAHAYTHGLRGDHVVRKYSHARHCVHSLLNKSYYAPRQDEIAVHGNVVFGNC
jgi:hypothetical protein